MSRVLGIVCRQTAYTERLSEELCKEEFREWQLATFTSLSEFVQWEGSTAVRLLLLDESFFDEWQRLMEDGVQMPFCVWLTEDTEALERIPGIFMYQSAEQIGRQLSEIYQKQVQEKRPSELPGTSGRTLVPQTNETSFEEAPEQGAPEETGGISIIGVLSPCGGAGVTGFALACGKELARKGTVLFLSLDPYPGLPAESQSVSELLYLLREYGAGWVEQREQCIRQQGRLGIVAGMADGSDLWELGTSEWNSFLEGLRQSGAFSFLVMDCGAGCAAREAILRECDCLFLLGEEDSPKIALWKRQFLRFARSVEALSCWRAEGAERPERERVIGYLRRAGLWKEAS